VSYGEQQRYILSEEDVRGLHPNKQFLFVNNCKPILADKIRYWNEPWFAERCGDFFHETPAEYVQLRGRADLPGKPKIDWAGVRCVQAPPPMPPTPKEARRRARQAIDAARAAAETPGVQEELFGSDDEADSDLEP
jgi:type IV secretion system protein VirD4